VSRQFYISMSVSLGITDFLAHISIDSEIKWPNDIYVNDKKIAGILIENSVMNEMIVNSVAGIGININQGAFSINVPNATSVCLESGSPPDIKDAYRSLIMYLNKRIDALYNLEYNSIMADYTGLLLLLNKEASFTDKNGIFQGTIVGIEEAGMILIKTGSNKIRKYDFREVAFPR